MLDQGRVKWFNNGSGWGFIAAADGREIMVHHDQILGDGYKSLYEGDLVSYEVKKSRSGFSAVNVTVLESDIDRSHRRVS